MRPFHRPTGSRPRDLVSVSHLFVTRHLPPRKSDFWPANWFPAGQPASATFLSLVLVTGLTVILLASAQPMPVVAQGPDRLVLAFYYNWFGPNDWKPGKLVDAPQAPYTSSDRGAMGRHIDQAKAAGIDALLVNWYGPAAENNQTETNLCAMLDEAAARGFRLAVDVDMNSPQFGSAAAMRSALATLLSGHAQHPAYLHSGGKPVVFFYHQSARFSTDTWAGIRAAVDPNHNSLWIEEGTAVSLLSVFDGHHLYSVTWPDRTDMGYTAQKFARRVRDAAGRLGTPKIYIATVMPGYDDRKAPGRGGTFAVGREDGAYYERSWRGAISAAPDWIVINSFNEWYEGDYIEPSQAYGNRYLDLTAAWSATFHNSSPPPVMAAAAVVPTAAAQAVAPASVPTRRPQPPVPTPTPAPPPERPVRMGPHGPSAL
jgi:hypothetical protein